MTRSVNQRNTNTNTNTKLIAKQQYQTSKQGSNNIPKQGKSTAVAKPFPRPGKSLLRAFLNASHGEPAGRR
jgi:hypothetical protein